MSQGELLSSRERACDVREWASRLWLRRESTRQCVHVDGVVLLCGNKKRMGG